MRGDKRLFVSSTARFSMNAWVRMLLDNRNNSLVADLHSGLIPPDPSFHNRNDAVMFNFKVTEVGVCAAAAAHGYTCLDSSKQCNAIPMCCSSADISIMFAISCQYP
jgi:hypothetical protein